MSTFALPRRSIPVSSRKKPLSERVEVGITAVLVVMGLLLSTLSLSYLFYANEKATQDYHLRILQEKRSSILQKNEVLSMQIAQLESLENLQQNKKIRTMVDAGEILHIRGDTQVAQNQ
jgi:hypothetical protein